MKKNKILTNKVGPKKFVAKKTGLIIDNLKTTCIPAAANS